ncbi:MAG: hypothetical protein ACPGJS_05270 [Flammeovirgaceae bacterium]
MKKVLFICLLAFLASCDLVKIKDGGTEETDPLGTIPSYPTTEAQFTQLFHSNVGHTWEADGFTLAGTEGFLDCRLDDKIILKADATNSLVGTYEYNGGTDLCGAEDDQTSRFGTYQIDFANNQVVFDAGTSNETTAKVTGLDETAIVLEGSYLGMEIRGKYLIQ